MDIVKHIKQHTENLHTELSKSSAEQRKNLKLATLGFYFHLPDFENVISKYIKIDIDKNQLISDISKGNLENYQKAIEKSLAETDEYSDDYEEPESIEIFILEAFGSATSDLKDLNSLEGLFAGIIDVLDYYENFSDNPEYWNTSLEKEVAFQNEILNMIKTQDNFDTSIYLKQYNDVKFEKL
ncbi:hypothetical protein [Epilithonimonas xixisoli]|uniref:Uncharacterized protein n=1 Tax=Epilithonimonas xixisoli TaxID=1476462 RepID=A0A4R8IAW8_9FLAO|nr:hypothetical protein [Epilithonimonas xixisoli]TDX87288.1 hypothetical protein B0I22_1476 [Epilithonimonas xixisoli]